MPSWYRAEGGELVNLERATIVSVVEQDAGDGPTEGETQFEYECRVQSSGPPETRCDIIAYFGDTDFATLMSDVTRDEAGLAMKQILLHLPGFKPDLAELKTWVRARAGQPEATPADGTEVV